MDFDFWQRQTDAHPLFKELEWSRPEQKSRAGQLGIIGGNKLGFHAIAESYETSLATGAGQVRVLLPDCLKKSLPMIPDAIFGACNPSGSLSADAITEMRALGEWANEVLLIGDAGRNSETAVLYETWIRSYEGPLTVTRDAIDLVKNAPDLLVERPDTMLVASFAQIQKLFSGVYYPKILTFSMQLAQLVEALHKFTITYPCTIVTLHRDQIIIANDGAVVTQEFTDAMRIWRGDVATKAAVWWLWSRDKTLASAVASLAFSK